MPKTRYKLLKKKISTFKSQKSGKNCPPLRPRGQAREQMVVESLLGHRRRRSCPSFDWRTFGSLLLPLHQRRCDHPAEMSGLADGQDPGRAAVGFGRSHRFSPFAFHAEQPAVGLLVGRPVGFMYFTHKKLYLDCRMNGLIVVCLKNDICIMNDI